STWVMSMILIPSNGRVIGSAPSEVVDKNLRSQTRSLFYLVVPAEAGTHDSTAMEFRNKANASHSLVVSCRGVMDPGLRRGDKKIHTLLTLARASVPLAGWNELEILERRLGKERLVCALRQWPQDRRRLIPGVPVLAAADPDSA